MKKISSSAEEVGGKLDVGAVFDFNMFFLWENIEH